MGGGWPAANLSPGGPVKRECFVSCNFHTSCRDDRNCFETIDLLQSAFHTESGVAPSPACSAAGDGHQSRCPGGEASSADGFGRPTRTVPSALSSFRNSSLEAQP